MTWLTPTLAGIVAAIAVPSLVILYFLKLRRQNIEISTTLLWKKSIQDLQANAPFQRLRRNILLLLQLIALAAILFALAQPQRTNQQQAVGVRRVILLDRSASMNATDTDPESGKPGKTRLEVAKDEAIELVNAMRQSSFMGLDLGIGDSGGKADETMLISFDSSAEVVQQFTSDKAALIRAIKSVIPSDTPSELRQAMTLARAHLPSQTYYDDRSSETIKLEGRTLGNVAVHIFSDGRLPDAAEVLTQATDGSKNHPIEFVSVGSSQAVNTAITGFSAERDYENPQKLAVFVGLESTAHEPRTVELTLLIDGVAERVRDVTIPSATKPEGVIAGIGSDGQAVASTEWIPGSIGVVFPLERNEGGVFAASITPAQSSDATSVHDALPTDDRAWLIVPRARRLSVAFVTARGNMYIREQLLGEPLAALAQFTPEQYASAIRDGSAARFDVAVMPLDEEGKMAPGRYLIYGALPPPPDGVIAGEAVGGAQFIDWKRDHPVLRAVNLDGVLIAEMPRVTVPETSATQVLAESEAGPALLELSTADVRALIVPFDSMRSTWPLDLSWPVFNAAAIRYLGLEVAADESGSRVIHPGEVLVDRLPAGSTKVVLEDPSGERFDLQPAADGRVVFGPVRKVGAYSIRWSGQTTGADESAGSGGTRAYAVSLLNPEESNIPSRDSLQLAATTVLATDTGTTRAAQRLWPYMLLLAIAVLLFEWWVYNRKVYL